MPKPASVLALVALTLALSACSSPADAPQPSATASASPSPSTSTEAQVASVVAGYETDWRETIDGAGACRFDWVAPSDPSAEARGIACWYQAQTLELQAKLAQRDLGELVIPASMERLVADFTGLLGLIANNDATASCGTGSIPSNSDECNEKLANQFFLFGELEDELDKWAPYM